MNCYSDVLCASKAMLIYHKMEYVGVSEIMNVCSYRFDRVGRCPFIHCNHSSQSILCLAIVVVWMQPWSRFPFWALLQNFCNTVYMQFLWGLSSPYFSRCGRCLTCMLSPFSSSVRMQTMAASSSKQRWSTGRCMTESVKYQKNIVFGNIILCSDCLMPECLRRVHGFFFHYVYEVPVYNNLRGQVID